MSMFASSSSGAPTYYEVERKFSLINHDDISRIQQRLTQLGFINNSCENELTDWYYDTRAYQLIQQDCWLRLRQIHQITSETAKTTDNKNSHHQYDNKIWQLKLGCKKDRKKSLGESKSSTVYQEIEGLEAFSVAVSLLSDSGDEFTTKIKSSSLSSAISNDSYDDVLKEYDYPEVPPSNIPLLPFARIKAKRSTWKCNMSLANKINSEVSTTSLKGFQKNPGFSYSDLVIDFDVMDIGYAVGEVECLVQQLDQIEHTRHRIDSFLQCLLADDTRTSSSSLPILGKLEYYLQQKRPQLYQMLIDIGIMKEQ